LRVRDGGEGDTGTITAATLNLTGTAGPSNCTTARRPVDFNGDGKSDFGVVRNTGGGPNGQTTWFIGLNGGGQAGGPWGLASDFFVPNDFDGDGKTDLSVWRPGASGVAAWYILQSGTNTLRQDTFGQTGDDPTVVGDYDGDGKSDPAVYRAGATAGAQSFWYYRASAAGPNQGNIVYNQWGQNGDFPGPGDYDGDNKMDFAVQRNNGGGQARFLILQSTAGFSSTVFGTPTDVIVPGYYDSDCKTDIATLRGASGQIQWQILNSTNSTISYYVFGASATDFPTQGDYDGDGKIDISVWRPNADPTQCYFYWLNSTNNALGTYEHGQNGDYPVADFNRH
jgi:hypothetical protein